MVSGSAVPPVATVYHLMLKPANTTRLATVGLELLQKLWAVATLALVVTIIVTDINLLALSHPPTVWLT